MNDPSPQNKWHLLMSLFLNKEANIFKEEVYKFESEIKTQHFIHGTKVVRDTFTQWIDTLPFAPDSCGEQKSIEYREAGNRLFTEDKKLNSWKAFELYSKAVYAAPLNSSALALAHANRAASLVELEFFKEAFDDCESALLLGYAEKNISKLLIRQLHCASKLHDYSLMETLIGKLRKRQNGLNQIFKKQFDDFVKDFDSMSCQDISDHSPGEEQNKSQEVLSSPTRGRYVIANESIAKDETIMSENAFAFVPILPSDVDNIGSSHCNHCAIELITSFPCYKCKQIAFCSLQCKTDHGQVHQYECAGIRNGLLMESGIAYLAMRTFLNGFHEITPHLSIDKLCTADEIWQEIFEISKLNQLRYNEALEMITNLEKINSDDFLKYALTASMLVCYLKTKTCIFNKLSIHWEIVAASLILRHISQMVCNAHTIAYLTPINATFSIWSKKEHLKLGKLHTISKVSRKFAAIYPKISLYNHSCDPSYSNKFNKFKCTAIARRDIKNGDEIFNCYGQNIKTTKRRHRMENLEMQYCFQCDCKDCRSGKDEVFNKFHQYRCRACQTDFSPGLYNLFWWEEDNLENIHIKCPNCQCSVNLCWVLEFKNLLSTNKIQDSLQRIFEIFKHSNELLIGPNELKIHMTKLFLITIFKDVNVSFEEFSNESYDNILKITDDFLNVLKDLYGELSMEYVSGLSFYLDLLAISQRKAEQIEHFTKSLVILSDHIYVIFVNYINDYIKT